MKNYKTKLLAISLSIGVTACATPSYNYVPQVEYISRPELNITTTSSVGDQMLIQGNLSAQDGIKLTTSTKVSLYTFSPGFYPETGSDEKHTYYSFITGDGQNSIGGLGSAKKSIIADPITSIAITKEDQRFCAVTALNLKTCEKNITFQKDQRSNESLNSFQQTLLYSGRVGDKINISYREFSGNSARPAFNNDVEYDLNESRTIAYKGAEIDVLEADNRSITYIVKRNFRQPSDLP